MDASFVSDVLKMTNGDWEALKCLVNWWYTNLDGVDPGIMNDGWVVPRNVGIPEDTFDTLLVRGYAEKRHREVSITPEYRALGRGIQLLTWRENLKTTLFNEWLDKQRG